MVDQVAKSKSVGERVFKEHLGGISGLGKEIKPRFPALQVYSLQSEAVSYNVKHVLITQSNNSHPKHLSKLNKNI